MPTSVKQAHEIEAFSCGFPSDVIGSSLIVNADTFEWLRKAPPESIHAVVTDPPYGVKEYQADQLEKRESGRGGIWRIPPSFDGHVRAPLPRFTALNARERATLVEFFTRWSQLLVPVLRPGAHVFVAGNAFLAQLVYTAIIQGGLEFRGQLIRVVRTLRGGDRPKNAEEEFPDVSSLPRGNYEPWGIFRRPLPNGMKVSECLRRFETGGLRRNPDGLPFSDLIFSERTPERERNIVSHPSLKPQTFMRQIIYAALPLGTGVVIDPFMGSGSTVAAGEAQRISCIGVEVNPDYYAMSKSAIPRLAKLTFERDQIPFRFV